MSDSVTDTTIPGGWTEQQISLAGRTLNLLLPADADAFLDALTDLPICQQDQHDIYWARMWSSAPRMALRVLSRDWLAGTEALEFGCGIGLVGLAALLQGLDVTFSDYQPLAVQTAAENARRNGYQARGVLLDWRAPPDRPYPLLFGCDVLYDRALYEPLVRFLDAALTSDGLCWIGDAGRYYTADFLALLARHGFNARLEDEHGRELAEPHYGKFQLLVIERRS